MAHSEQHSDNPFALVCAKGVSTSYVACNQFKSLDWRARGAKPQALGGGHMDQLAEALALLDQICAFASATR